jgi:hypothetical protein
VRRPRAVQPHVDRSAFAGFRFPREVITVAVRWYLRYGLSYRDVEELLAKPSPLNRWITSRTYSSSALCGVVRSCRPARGTRARPRSALNHGYARAALSSASLPGKPA